MDARLVWRTWRSILRSDDLIDAVLNPGQREPAPAATSQSDASLVLASYAADRLAADFTISMYRRGLVRNALSALILAPMSRRLLYAGGLDVGQVAEAYARSIGYRDDGPNFWRAAASFVEFLGKLPEFAPPPRQAVILFESALIAHMRNLGKRQPAVWPGPAGSHAPAVDDLQAYLANSACTVHASHCDLTPWLEDPAGFDINHEPARGTRHWLISVSGPEAAHTCAELSARAARAFTLLAVPNTSAGLAEALDLPLDETRDVLHALLGSAALVPAPAPAASAAGQLPASPYGAVEYVE